MTYHTAYYIYFASLLFASVCSLSFFRKLDKASKILAILVCCAFINEVAAYFVAKKYHNNLPQYALYCLLEFGLLSLYFNNVIDVFMKKNLGIYVGILGILFGTVNLVFIQSLNSLNSYFLFFEGLAVIGMCLFTFFRLLLKHDSLHLTRYHHFWFISILLFFWSTTFLNWGLYDYINLKLQNQAWKINFTFLLLSAFVYGGFGVVYLLYPKMQRSSER